jgi:hypothetical protein
MYVGIFEQGSEFEVTLGGTNIIPAQEPCPSADACPITSGCSSRYRFISVEVMPATVSPILEITAIFNSPEQGTYPMDILVDLVQMKLVCTELTEGRNCVLE